MAAGLWQPKVTAGQDQFTIPPVTPNLLNSTFECDNGLDLLFNPSGVEVFVPRNWTLSILSGAPIVHSARVFFEQRANAGADCFADSVHVERIEGHDSWVVRAEDLETPPEPGKPFDVVLYQRIPATVGGAYSASGWFLSLCGGSNTPSDCPDGQYILKGLGLGTQGGIDPDAPDVVWSTSDANFVTREGERVGWTNLRTSAVARNPFLTVFARLHSPFRWHGNHGFIDAVSVVRAPIARFLTTPGSYDSGQTFVLQWEGVQSPDIGAIPGGTYALLYDIDVRTPDAAEWQPLVSGTTATEFEYQPGCTNVTYEFRLRARSEQPPAPPEGASPNQRYPGVWSAPLAIEFTTSNDVTKHRHVEAAQLKNSIYLPMVADRTPC